MQKNVQTPSTKSADFISLDKETRDRYTLKIAELQRKVVEMGISVMVILDGWGGSGKSEVLNRLVLPLDPRHFIVYNETRLTNDLKYRPIMFRYWDRSPAKGEIVLFDSSYYYELFLRKVLDDRAATIKEINHFESELANAGTKILKCFLQISKKEQKKRFRRLEKSPITAWKVTGKDWKQNEKYKETERSWNTIFAETSTPDAPWTIVDASNVKFAADTLLVKLYETLDRAVAEAELEAKNPQKLVPLIKAEGHEEEIKNSALNNLKAQKPISDEAYKKKLDAYYKRLRDIEFLIYTQRIPVMILFEGFDAAGKGGAIKRLCKNLDPLGYRVYPSSAPTTDEKAHFWLWRYWRAVPKRGHFSIFDRTWYGRVLVEPIEGLLTKEAYDRAYQEINDFEAYLSGYGCVIIKFWMNISSEEQLKRFKEREDTPDKQWKITDEDWRNRDKRDAYIVAADQMLKKTSTEYAPWTIINGDDKRNARLTVLKTVADSLEKCLDKKNRKMLGDGGKSK